MPTNMLVLEFIS